nr:MAG TPA: hypothetical protein [Caudoviricetes sp.]
MLIYIGKRECVFTFCSQPLKNHMCSVITN